MIFLLVATSDMMLWLEEVGLAKLAKFDSDLLGVTKEVVLASDMPDVFLTVMEPGENVVLMDRRLAELEALHIFRLAELEALIFWDRSRLVECRLPELEALHAFSKSGCSSMSSEIGDTLGDCGNISPSEIVSSLNLAFERGLLHAVLGLT